MSADYLIRIIYRAVIYGGRIFVKAESALVDVTALFVAVCVNDALAPPDVTALFVTP